MNFARIAFIACVFLTWASAACAAEDRVVPCKNHYILDDPCPPDALIGSSALVRFAKVYSTMDGYDQAIELDVDASSGVPLRLGGRLLSVRDVHGSVRSQVLPATLDGPVKRQKLLLSNVPRDAWGDEVADLVLDRHFLPLDGGTLEIEGLDAWTYGALPRDGGSALARDGTVVPAVLSRYARASATPPPPELWNRIHAFAREYHHAGMDHYFVTASMTEIDQLDSGAVPGWRFTGVEFVVLARPLYEALPGFTPNFCRWLMRYEGGYTHVLSADAQECAAMRSSPAGEFESSAIFFGIVPDRATGACPLLPGTDTQLTPIYRFWNGSAQANHRWVRSPTTRNAMIAQGWVPEGYGPDGVVLCDWL